MEEAEKCAICGGSGLLEMRHRASDGDWTMFCERCAEGLIDELRRARISTWVREGTTPKLREGVRQ